MAGPSLSTREWAGPEQKVLKGPAEVPVEDSVDDRIKAAVAVTNPEEEFKESLRDAAVFPTYRFKAVCEEEWEPADHKSSNDHGQDNSKSALPGLHQPVCRHRHIPAPAMRSTGGN